MNNRGFTLLEVLMVSGIMAFMLVSVGAMTVATMRCYDRATARTYMDTDASTAMQKIVSDVREASDVKFIADGNRLRIIPPKTVEGHDYYNRYKPDNANQFDYYLSDSTGTPGHDGTWLWRGKNNNDRRPIMKDVTYLNFERKTDDSIAITVRVLPQCNSDMEPTELTERVVYLRNYAGKS
ncbi:MAG: prepilin-type N-terminal cleavage/methylation domain-containing protein [Armatimonadota bacterium]